MQNSNTGDIVAHSFYTTKRNELCEPFIVHGTSSCFRNIIRLGTIERYARNDEIHLNHERVTHFFYIVSGLVASVTPNSTDGIDYDLFYGENTLMKETNFFLNLPTVIYSKCLKDTTICKFDVSLFDKKFFDNHFDIFMNFLYVSAVKNNMHAFTRKLRLCPTAIQRLAIYLVALSDHFKRADVLYPRLNQTYIGKMLGISHASMVRSVQRLKACAILKSYLPKSGIVISDYDRLKDIALGNTLE